MQARQAACEWVTCRGCCCCKRICSDCNQKYSATYFSDKRVCGKETRLGSVTIPFLKPIELRLLTTFLRYRTEECTSCRKEVTHTWLANTKDIVKRESRFAQAEPRSAQTAGVDSPGHDVTLLSVYAPQVNRYDHFSSVLVHFQGGVRIHIQQSTQPSSWLQAR